MSSITLQRPMAIAPNGRPGLLLPDGYWLTVDYSRETPPQEAVECYRREQARMRGARQASRLCFYDLGVIMPDGTEEHCETFLGDDAANWENTMLAFLVALSSGAGKGGASLMSTHNAGSVVRMVDAVIMDCFPKSAPFLTRPGTQEVIRLGALILLMATSKAETDRERSKQAHKN